MVRYEAVVICNDLFSIPFMSGDACDGIGEFLPRRLCVIEQNCWGDIAELLIFGCYAVATRD